MCTVQSGSHPLDNRWWRWIVIYGLRLGASDICMCEVDGSTVVCMGDGRVGEAEGFRQGRGGGRRR